MSMRTYGGGDTNRDRRTIGVANLVVAADGTTLVAYGLGACVAIALHDADNGVGALAHTMLPEQPADSGSEPGKFADSAVRAMLQEMVEAGAAYASVEARLVGGASIFEIEGLNVGVGERTVEVARDQLDTLDVPVVAEAVGGDRGRTVEFDTGSGELLIYTAAGDEPRQLDGADRPED